MHWRNTCSNFNKYMWQLWQICMTTLPWLSFLLEGDWLFYRDSRQTFYPKLHFPRIRHPLTNVKSSQSYGTDFWTNLATFHKHGVFHTGCPKIGPERIQEPDWLVSAGSNHYFFHIHACSIRNIMISLVVDQSNSILIVTFFGRPDNAKFSPPTKDQY